MPDATTHALALRLLEARLARVDQLGRPSAALEELERLLAVSLAQHKAQGPSPLRAQAEERRHSE